MRSKVEFDAVFAGGQRGFTPECLVISLPNQRAYSRLGLSVGRRFGRAPQRNRAKRLLREAFRLEREQLPLGFDLVVIPRPGEFPNDLESVRQLLVRAAKSSLTGARQRPRANPPRKRGQR